MNEFAVDAVAVAVVIGVVNAAKPLGLSGKYAPVLSLALGVLYGIVFRQDLEITTAVLSGVMIGLSASGLFSGAKALRKPEWPTPTIDSLPDEK